MNPTTQADEQERRALAANIALALLSMVAGNLTDADDAKDEFLSMMREIDSAIESGFADPVETEH